MTNKPPSPSERRELIDRLVHTWRGQLSAKAIQHLSSFDTDALGDMIASMLDVVINRHGSVQGFMHAHSERVAAMRQDYDASVLDALQELERAMLTEPTEAVVHVQADPSDVAALIFKAVDMLETRRNED